MQKPIKKYLSIIIAGWLLFYGIAVSADTDGSCNLLPSRLRPGDTVALIAPGYRVVEDSDIEAAIERIEALGLQVKQGKHLYEHDDKFAGTDQQRTEDINEMFKDPEVKAIIAIRGGWGSNRILNLLDYEMIKQNPKIIMGYSDITSLLLAINAKTGMITFHGPMGVSTLTTFTTKYLREVLFDGKIVSFSNPTNVSIADDTNDWTGNNNRIITITEGTAVGKLLGGNLSLLTSMIGSEYLPDFDGAILFVEDVEEGVYRIDRMLTQLKMSGVLDQISGFVFGKCTDCGVTNDDSCGASSMCGVMKHYILPLNIPAFYGSMIGHVDDIFTLPEGAEVTIDADKGTITMLEPVVN